VERVIVAIVPAVEHASNPEAFKGCHVSNRPRDSDHQMMSFAEFLSTSPMR
jgi:hypothetical protein